MNKTLRLETEISQIVEKKSTERLQLKADGKYDQKRKLNVFEMATTRIYVQTHTHREIEREWEKKGIK